MCGRAARPHVYYQEHNFTGDKPQCLSGSDRGDSDCSNHIPADLLLLDICVSVYIYNIYANVCEWVSVCTPRKCIILMLLTLLLFYTSHKPLASLLSHLFVEIFCGMSFCRCPGSFCSSLLFLCRGQFPTQMLVVFSASLWPCCALDHRGPEAPLSVCVIFLRPGAETICRAPDMVTSVSSSGDSKPEVCTNLQMVWG